MNLVVATVALIAGILVWWLAARRLTTKGWEGQGTFDGRDTAQMRSTAPARAGLWVFLAVVTSFFALFVTAYLMRMNPDGTALEVFARGIRNTVGFDWDPDTHDIWFTDNGRDMLGDDLPPDELDHAARAGMHFGFPYCHGGDLPDPNFAGNRKCSEFAPPAQKFGAHVASLGMRFYTGSMFPREYANRIFIAEHGSWNRSKKSGYRVMQAKVENGKVVDYGVFAEGWLDKAADEAWGRPVDVQVMPDGALLVSDDAAGAIYRITYRGR